MWIWAFTKQSCINNSHLLITLKITVMKKAFFLTGSITTSVVIYSIVLWIHLFKTNWGTREELIELYLSYFPRFMRNVILLTLADISLCLISIFCFLILLNFTKSKIVKHISFLMLILNGIFISWLLLTLT